MSNDPVGDIALGIIGAVATAWGGGIAGFMLCAVGDALGIWSLTDPRAALVCIVVGVIAVGVPVFMFVERESREKAEFEKRMRR